MHRRIAALCLVLLGAGMLVVTSALPPSSAAEGPHRRYLPGLAADSAPAPTPTPTPLPGGSPNDTALRVALIIDIDAKELAVGPTGTTIVHITADARANLPSPTEPVVTVSGSFTIAPHPGDAAGCTWTRFFFTDIFNVTFTVSADDSVLASLQAPEWHYTMTCPTADGSTPPQRFPAFGEEGLFLFLLEAMEPYAATPPLYKGGGVRIPMDVVSHACIRRAKGIHVAASTGDVTVTVFVYQQIPGGCPLPRSWP